MVIELLPFSLELGDPRTHRIVDNRRIDLARLRRLRVGLISYSARSSEGWRVDVAGQNALHTFLPCIILSDFFPIHLANFYPSQAPFFPQLIIKGSISASSDDSDADIWAIQAGKSRGVYRSMTRCSPPLQGIGASRISITLVCEESGRRTDIFYRFSFLNSIPFPRLGRDDTSPTLFSPLDAGHRYESRKRDGTRGQAPGNRITSPPCR